ncbi:hypothetical protein OROHE_005407 [Orobanche hederae]
MSRVSGKNGSNMGYQKLSSIGSSSFKKAPENMLIPESDDDVGSIIQETYPQLLQNLWNPVFFQEKAILAPTHKMVDIINDRMISLIPRDEKLYESSDSICMADADTNFDESIYTTDFLNGFVGPSSKQELGPECTMDKCLIKHVRLSTGLLNAPPILIFLRFSLTCLICVKIIIGPLTCCGSFIRENSTTSLML